MHKSGLPADYIKEAEPHEAFYRPLHRAYIYQHLGVAFKPFHTVCRPPQNIADHVTRALLDKANGTLSELEAASFGVS